MEFYKLDFLCCTVYYMLNYFFPLSSYTHRTQAILNGFCRLTENAIFFGLI